MRLPLVPMLLSIAFVLVARSRPASALTTAATTSAVDPMHEVEAAIADATAIFKQTNMPLKERREKLRAVAEAHFDFDSMARSALGYHWRTLTPVQQQQFEALFGGFIEDVFLTKLHDYTVQKIQNELHSVQIRFVKQAYLGPSEAQVYTEIVLREQKEPIAVDYMLSSQSGRWRIYDITIEAISVIANYRNQFNRVINDHGYAQLVADLQAKRRLLQPELDQPSTSEKN